MKRIEWLWPVRIVLLTLIGAGISAPSSDGAEHHRQRRPNIVLFVADDLSRMEISCYGGGNARTPHLDRLASQGLRFEKCYDSMSVCAPTRALLYTGLYPVRNGSYRNHTACRPGTRSMVPDLRALGYRVGISGKTHVGPPESFPFEIVRSKEIETFITRDAAEPFCLVVASNRPHPPWRHGTAAYPPETLKLPPYWIDTADTRRLYSAYCADVDVLDAEVGSVMDLLEQTKTAADTLFVFLSEQGTDSSWAKWTCYEQGLHAGAIVRWPGVVKPGRIAQALVEYVDVAPTLIEAAGGTPRNDFDGRSFLAVLKGETDEHKQYTFSVYNNEPEGPPYPIRAVRSNRFSYLWNLTPQAEYRVKYIMDEQRVTSELDFWPSWLEKAKIDTAAARLVERYIHRPEEELYDLAADPWEMNNLAGKPEFATVKAELRSQLLGWMKQQGDAGASLDQPVPERGPWLGQPAK